MEKSYSRTFCNFECSVKVKTTLKTYLPLVVRQRQLDLSRDHPKERTEEGGLSEKHLHFTAFSFFESR